MYAFAQRNDTIVFDEPLYAYYLQHTNAKEYHPGANEIIKSQNTYGKEVVEMMLNTNQKEVLFFKNMTHHLIDLDLSFLLEMTNVFLTRHPKDMIASFAKVIPNPTIGDIGYAMHTKVLSYLEENGVKPIVLDSKKVLINPRQTLTQLCDAIGVSFQETMLNWEAKPRPEDGVWAKYWYENVHKSTHFSIYKPNKNPFPDYLYPLLEEAMPHYNKLKKYSIG